MLFYEYREKCGLSQKQLADKMGVKQQIISRVESGEANITLETLMRFLTTLGIVLKVDHTKRKRAEKVLQLSAHR
jgi:transcriptional regulator with XRE-family HTH domain